MLFEKGMIQEFPDVSPIIWIFLKASIQKISNFS